MNQRKIQMDNKQATSSVVGEMQTKNTMKHNYTPTRLPNIERQPIPSVP